MKEIKVIDLVVKIANGEIPKKIRYNDLFMTYDEKRHNYYDSFGAEIDWKYTIMQYLNDKVEIIEDIPEEDKKIEKLDVVLLGQYDNWLQPTIDTDEKIRAELNPYIIDVIRENTLVIQRKINEIIDKINGEE